MGVSGPGLPFGGEHPCFRSLAPNFPRVVIFHSPLPSLPTAAHSQGTTARGGVVLTSFQLLVAGLELTEVCTLMKSCAPEPNP